MKILKLPATIALLLLVGACSDDGREAERPSVRDNIVWGEQVRSLDKARQVEGTIQSGADHRKQMIEAQTR